MIKSFNNLYSDDAIKKRVNSLAWRYFSSYRYQFNILAMAHEDIVQELWLNVWRSGDFDKDNIINRMIDDIYNMLEASTREKRSYIYADNEQMAIENDNGELETDDEVMGRLVYSGRGNYIK